MKELNSLIYFFLLVKFCLGNNEEDEKVKPGTYIQWKEKLPLTKLDQLGNINPNYKPDCKAECGKKCEGHKGVSICGSMFEYADDPNDDSMDSHYHHCFCQMSTMKVREPGKYCGPHKKLCKNIPDVEDLSEIKPPNPKGEFWIDGVNTFFNAPKGKQGIKHVENFNNVVETPAPPNTTTEAGPGTTPPPLLDLD